MSERLDTIVELPDTGPVCAFRWSGTRIDTDEPTVPVNHVCGKPNGHLAPHLCPCGATYDESDVELRRAMLTARRLRLGGM